jgi:MFS family permease
MTYRMMAISIPLIVVSLGIPFLKRPPPTTTSSLIEIGTSGARVKDPLVVNEEWALRSWNVQSATATKQFWILAVSFFLANVMSQSIFTHQVAFFVDQGLEALFASYIVGLVGIVSLGSKILWAVLSDKRGREIIYMIGMIWFMFGIITLILFTTSRSPGLPYFYSLFFGLGYAVTAALPPLIVADFFEGQGYGGIFGALNIFVGIGGAFGAWFAGFLYDQAGSYLPVFVIVMVCAFFSCLGIWWAAPRKIRMVPGKSLR